MELFATGGRVSDLELVDWDRNLLASRGCHLGSVVLSSQMYV
jgi:hypothetical protein